MNFSVPSPGLVLVAYAETLCRGVRVLIVGDARSPLVSAVVDRGARLVHVCDRDAARRAEAAARNQNRSVSFGTLDEGPAALRESFFELALIEDLTSEADARATLSAVSRLLTPRGAALVVAPNPDGGAGDGERALDYYALYDAAAHAFPHVRMLGQVPFVGYAVVDFAAEGEPNAVLDASLMPPRGEEPAYFIALAGREPRALDEYAVIQLPASSVRTARGDEPVAAARPEPSSGREATAALNELHARIQRQEAWITELELRATTADERADTADAELEELREQLAKPAAARDPELPAVAAERDTLRADVERLHRTANGLSEELSLAKGELQAKDNQLRMQGSELKTKESELKTRESELKARESELQRELTALRARVTELETTLSELHAKLTERQTALSELQAVAEDTATGQDLARLEAQLQERSQAIRLLENKLREAERIGRELVRRLSEQALVAPTPGLSHRLAEAEAELVTLRWSLQIAGTPGAAGALG